MLKSILDSTPVPLLTQVAKFAERRQDVLAGNIANFDTPGYRMRELPQEQFQRALELAIEQRQRPPTTTDSASALLSPGSPAAPTQLLSELFPESLFQAQSPLEQDHITFQDANNRSVEHQFLQMTKNSLIQQFALEIMRNQFDQLQTVISERV